MSATMKQAMALRWQRVSDKVDTLTVRERALVGGAGAALIAALVFFAVTDPAHARQRTLAATIAQQRDQIAAIDGELAVKAQQARVDPDADARERLARLLKDNEARRTTLRTVQKGLVSPDKMGQLLQQVLQSQGKLRLVSLKTLAPRGMSDGRFSEPDSDAAAMATAAPGSVAAAATAAATAAAGAAPKPIVEQRELLYRHGVQVVLQGSYLDMIAYMEALERTPAQLFWGKADLSADAYPKASLTLTLYTLSLDQKWIAL